MTTKANDFTTIGVPPGCVKDGIKEQIYNKLNTSG